MRLYPVFLFSIWVTYILTGGLSVAFLCFLMMYSKWSWKFETEYDPLGNLSSLVHVGADILNLLFLYGYLYFSIYSIC